MTAYEASPVKRQRSTNAQLDVIDQAIIQAVEDDHPVSLRGVFYRVVSAGAIEKTEEGYDLIGRQLLKLRRAGAVPYSSITDGTRYILRPRTNNDIEEMLTDAAASYRRALWHDQQVDVIIVSEKDAITGILDPVTDQWDVPLCICRGYGSETFAYSVAQSIHGAMREGKEVYVYQFGDHDPSGVDAWKSFAERIDGFVRGWAHGQSSAHYERLAVTENQIVQLSLPTRPTKKTDSRAKGFAGESVEVDAIPASILRQIANEAIVRHIDQDALRLTRVAEDSERLVLTAMAGSLAGRDDPLPF